MQKNTESAHDKREYHLQVTQKYKDYYNISNDYVHAVTERIRQRFSPEECAEAGRDAHHYQPGTDARGGSADPQTRNKRRGL